MLAVILSFFVNVQAQEDNTSEPVPLARLRRENKEMAEAKDSLSRTTEAKADTVLAAESKRIDEKIDSVTMRFSLTADSLSLLTSSNIKTKFIPDPKKALWLAIVFPGGGQIYNKKYWKIPLVYGGFLGCIYAMNWNNTMYRDYSQAYIDIMDSDENTKSYENFIPKTYDIKGNMQRLQDLFKRKKNFYRRYRDLSMFCMIGVYALSIVDAYVDAELSSFDISSDLSMNVHPTIINDKFSPLRATGKNNNSYGLQCSIYF